MIDLIERQAAIDTLQNGAELLKRALDEMDIVGNEREKFAWGLELIEACIDDLKELPPAQPERKTGKWIPYEEWYGEEYYECSVCKEAFTFIDRAPSENLYNFCPNCGAHMMEEEHETD